MDIFNYRGVHNNLNRLPGQTHTGWTSMSGKHMAAVAGNVIIGRAGKIEKIWNKYDNGQLKALSDRKVSTEALDPYRPDAKLGQRERPADEGGSKSFSEPAIDAKPLAVAIPERVPADKRAAVNAIANRVATEFAGMQKIGQQKLNYQLRELRSEIFELAHDAIENPNH